MFNAGTRSTGGDLEVSIRQKIDSLLVEFAGVVQRVASALRVRRAMVRSLISCNLVIILDSRSIWLMAEKSVSMPTTTYLDKRSREFPFDEVSTAARWEFGLENAFVLALPVDLLDQSSSQRSSALEAIAQAHVQSELNRVHAIMNVVPVSPIFGPASYQLDPRLVFVLMPFTEDLTNIYQSIIKPTIEAPEFTLVCKRADDIKSNRAIIQDIWKSLCEARLVIADLTGFNANVLYELGIAHTLGKETILIYQRGADVKFPFDLAHIRRIEYENNALGGKQLEGQLAQTIRALIDNQVRA